MTRGNWRWPLVIVLAVATFAFGVVLSLPFSSRAQQPAPPSTAPATTPTPAPPPPTASAPESDYVGADTCKGCHEEAYNKFAKTRMGRLFLFQARTPGEKNACENCHGPGKAHVEAGGGKGKGGLITFARNDPTPVEKRNAVCLECHTKGARIFWKGSGHESRNVACTNCHTLMQDVSPKHQLAKANEIETCGTCHLQKRAQTMRSSHMPVREGKMTCSSCHNPHGSVTPALLKENSLNDNCFTCHAEKRGPFLWNHQPVLESCANCHDPHGSNHDAMLRLAKPRLCQQCHTESGHVSRPYGPIGPQQKFVMGRSCNDCHVAVHGSNHPAGFRLTR
jgi:DmsE family decaheme c-type cytochrome